MAVTCIFKYQSDTFTCFQKEKWDWRGQSKKKYSGVGGGGEFWSRARKFGGLRSVLVEFWRVTHTSLFTS